MRRILALTALLALALPASLAARSRTPSDGTLSVRNARGTITIVATGGVIGSFAQGKVRIVDPVEEDGSGPVVKGDDVPPLEVSDTTTVYGGKGVRFRMIGGAFRIRVQGRGINLSVVGKGKVTMVGAGTLDDGSYSANGGDYSPIPAFRLAFLLSATSP